MGLAGHRRTDRGGRLRGRARRSGPDRRATATHRRVERDGEGVEQGRETRRAPQTVRPSRVAAVVVGNNSPRCSGGRRAPPRTSTCSSSTRRGPSNSRCADTSAGSALTSTPPDSSTLPFAPVGSANGCTPSRSTPMRGLLFSWRTPAPAGAAGQAAQDAQDQDPWTKWRATSRTVPKKAAFVGQFGPGEAFVVNVLEEFSPGEARFSTRTGTSTCRTRTFIGRCARSTRTSRIRR